MLIRWLTYAIASQDEELINIGLNNSLRCVRVTSNQILHVRIAQRTSHRKHTIDTVIQDQASCTSNSLAFILIAALVIVR